MLPTMVTSRPSSIQVIPSAATTSQCQRLNGSRSNLAGIRLSTVFISATFDLLCCFALRSAHPLAIAAESGRQSTLRR